MKKGLDFVILFVGVACAGGDSDSEDVTLTTATVKQETTPKPTSVFGRINIGRIVEDREHAPLDIFKLRAADIRRTRVNNLWNWDYWCQLQPKMGNCTENIKRYYYDAQLDQCVSFTYTGCHGNKNRFDTSLDCERYCKGAAFMAIKDTDNMSFCSLQPNAGLCMAMFHRYYYDVNDENCKSYIYGGCGGNQNRFDTIQECMTTCHA